MLPKWTQWAEETECAHWKERRQRSQLVSHLTCPDVSVCHYLYLGPVQAQLWYGQGLLPFGFPFQGPALQFTSLSYSSFIPRRLLINPYLKCHCSVWFFITKWWREKSLQDPKVYIFPEIEFWVLAQEFLPPEISNSGPFHFGFPVLWLLFLLKRSNHSNILTWL